MFTLALNGISVAWTTGGNNQTANIFSAKLEWTDSETRVYNSLINLASQLGKAAGALYGGALIVNGRREPFILHSVLSILSCLIMQIVSVPTLVIGKFLHGVTVTVVHMASNKMISETVPVDQLGKFGSAFSILNNVGYTLVLGFGLLLPSGDYNPALVNDPANLRAKQADIEDQWWHFVLFFPFIVNSLILINYMVYIKEDSIMFNLSQGEEAGALRLIEKIYDTSGDHDGTTILN